MVNYATTDLKVVAPLVFLHSIVVGEFHDKVVILRPKTDHGFTPKSIIRAIVRQTMHSVKIIYKEINYSVINRKSVVLFKLSNANV